MPPKGWRKPKPEGTQEVARVRHDADDAPVDGDYTKDVVLGKDPAKTYALVHADDMPVMKGRGYVRTERAPGAPRPAYDLGDDKDPGYTVDNLTLMEIARERAEAIQARAERRGNAAWDAHRHSIAHPRGNSDVGVRTDTFEQQTVIQ